jgi:hypothetical protein
MPAFDVGRYLATVLTIGVIAGALMWAYDQLATPFNSLSAAGLVSHIAVQSQTVIYWGIVAYAPINLLFATVAALLVANARSEVNSPLIMTDFGGHIILAVVVIASLIFNLLITGYLDPFMMSVSTLVTGITAIDPSGIAVGILTQAFSACHLLCAIAVAVAYLYMILGSVRIQALQWSV